MNYMDSETVDSELGIFGWFQNELDEIESRGAMTASMKNRFEIPVKLSERNQLRAYTFKAQTTLRCLRALRSRSGPIVEDQRENEVEVGVKHQPVKGTFGGEDQTCKTGKDTTPEKGTSGEDQEGEKVEDDPEAGTSDGDWTCEVGKDSPEMGAFSWDQIDEKAKRRREKSMGKKRNKEAPDLSNLDDAKSLRRAIRWWRKEARRVEGLLSKAESHAHKMRVRERLALAECKIEEDPSGKRIEKCGFRIRCI
jgi:hypothetical protein